MDFIRPFLPDAPGVYAIETRAGDCYIGATRNLRTRGKQWHTGFGRGTRVPYRMRDAADRCGVMRMRVLELCAIGELPAVEEKWTLALHPNLNERKDFNFHLRLQPAAAQAMQIVREFRRLVV